MIIIMNVFIIYILHSNEKSKYVRGFVLKICENKRKGRFEKIDKLGWKLYPLYCAM